MKPDPAKPAISRLAHDAMTYGATALFAFSCMVSVSASAFAQVPPKLARAIEDSARGYANRYHIPALSLTVTRGRAVVYHLDLGQTDLENHVVAVPDSRYRIASVAKPITATAILQLVQNGKLNLDMPVQTIVPELRTKPDITIRQLLNHTSGIRHYKDDAEFNAITHCDSLRSALDIFASDSLVAAPGQKITYSSWGFVLLGLVVERVSGLRFSDYLQRNIFEPAHMTHTRIDEYRKIIPGRARGYMLDSTGNVLNANWIDLSCRIPAGGLLSTSGDLARFIIALQSGVLLSTTLQTMAMSNQVSSTQVANTLAGLPVPKGYEPPGMGFGWAIDSPGRKGAVWHGGNQQGATSIVYFLPRERLGIAILMNLEAQGDVVTRLADLIANLLAPN
jgi:CubicO group peptidase (beta-lactamase class C family)